MDITHHDDGGDPDKAVILAKELIGKDSKILAGTASSGIALKLVEQAEQNKVLYIPGPAATDAVTGANKYTFRSGRQSLQDVATADTFVDDPHGQEGCRLRPGQRVWPGQPRSGEAGARCQRRRGQRHPGSRGRHRIHPVRPPAHRQQAGPRLCRMGRAASGGMWQALDQQGAFERHRSSPGLATSPPTGPLGTPGKRSPF